MLVLDDSDLLDPATLRAVVDVALEELPPESTVALASRGEPPLPLARWRAHRVLTEVRTAQLAMSPAEAAALLRRAAIEPDFEQVRALVRRTEGWPAALYLAALARRQDPEDPIDFGEHHVLSEYVRDEVVAALPQELAQFSVKTSILDELSGGICDFVLERRGSAAVLERLAKTTPMLVPVDSSHRSYRWHGLMAEVLRAELRREDEAVEQLLRRRAADWYSACGDSRSALDQSSLAADARFTGELLWPNLLTYLTCGSGELIRGWLDKFNACQIADNAPLALSVALTSLIGGDLGKARQWALAASALLNREGAAEELQSSATALTVIETIDAHGSMERMRDLMITAGRSEDEDSLWRPLCLLLGAIAMYLEGDREHAEPVLDQVARLSGNRAPSVTSICLAQRALIAIEQEDWELATELTDDAVAMIEEWGLTTEPLSAIVFACAAATRAQQRRIDEAKLNVRRAGDLLAELGDFVPWYGAQARILLGHASLWLADVVAARTLLAEASRFARKTPDALVFAEWFDRAWAHLDTLAETSLVGPSSLTIAELRILRFLPSHRSFREIAEQLGVSSNTVKTQAHAVYRKLGVASRSEAVSRAIDAGLLSG
ncbi:MAG: hypothetical protein JOZ73_07180 [Solirubrobacterales bacterium]|nr:hypothetical protein [Solirubrobacterales bacterium]